MALEIEKTYLAKYIPPDLAGTPHDELEDVYLFRSDGLSIRARRKGEHFEFTIKKRVGTDTSRHTEITIPLAKDQYEEAVAGESMRLRKCRYYYPWQGYIAEVDVFSGSLEGLVVIEFEFSSQEEKDAFVAPDFCLADVTSEKFMSGGDIAGRTFAELEAGLSRFGYGPLLLKDGGS